MNNLTIKIYNYRKTSHSNPIELEIKEGITFILGLNNIGKSNLLKFFYELRQIFQMVANNINGLDSSIGLNPYFDQIVHRKHMDQAIKVEFGHGELKYTLQLKPQGGSHTNSYRIQGNLENPQREDISEFQKKIQALGSTLYIGNARNAIAEASSQYFDVEIGSRFIQVWSQWAGGNEIEKIAKIESLIEELKELLSFSNFNITVNHEKTNLLISTDDGKFALDELGGGVSHFIFVLGNALIRTPNFILIDEPELGLHPKMQEVFVRALAAKAKIGLLASSHSIGLARSTADSILSLTKQPDGLLNLAPFGQHYIPTIGQSINEMGYSQFTEIGGNNILLVEGRTDIKSFREILRKFGIETSFIIISLGGSDFIAKNQTKIVDELGELKRLNAKSISVIFDSEKSSTSDALSPSLESFKKCCEELGFSAFPTEVHSTENYITQNVIDKVIGPGYRALDPYQNFNDPSFAKWDKNKNWLMFREMAKEDFDNTELKKFIEKRLVPMA